MSFDFDATLAGFMYGLNSYNKCKQELDSINHSSDSHFGCTAHVSGKEYVFIITKDELIKYFEKSLKNVYTENLEKDFPELIKRIKEKQSSL